jgi:hypothetical protein
MFIRVSTNQFMQLILHACPSKLKISWQVLFEIRSENYLYSHVKWFVRIIQSEWKLTLCFSSFSWNSNIKFDQTRVIQSWLDSPARQGMITLSHLPVISPYFPTDGNAVGECDAKPLYTGSRAGARVWLRHRLSCGNRGLTIPCVALPSRVRIRFRNP